MTRALLTQMKYTPQERDYLRAKGAQFDDAEPENHFMWGAYLTLRASKNEHGYVPIGALSDYCNFAGLEDPLQKARLQRFVNALDQVEVDYGNAQVKG